MKRLLLVLWLTLASVSSSGEARAAVLGYEAAVTGLDVTNNALSLLGADPTADAMIFRWTFDDATPPFATGGPTTNATGTFSGAIYPYLSFEVEVGGVTLSVPEPFQAPNVSGFTVRDYSAAAGGSTTRDRVTLNSGNFFGPPGTAVSFIFGRATPSTDVISGTEHPDLTELNALGFNSSGITVTRLSDFSTGQVLVRSDSTVVISELPAVPVPAALPLLVTAGAGLWLLRRRAKTPLL